MKIRNGFVSNSSSSSFIIIVPNDKHSIIDKFKNPEKYNDNGRYYETYYDIISRKNGEVIIFGQKDNHDDLFTCMPRDVEYYNYH